MNAAPELRVVLVIALRRQVRDRPAPGDHFHPVHVAAQEAVDVFGIQDREVIEAVAFHSTGNAGLSDLGLVVYVADFLEPSRNWNGVEEFRRMVSGLELREAAYEVALRKTVRLEEKKQPVHPRSREMADWLTKIHAKGGT